jgi:hypothetical protein
MLHGNLRVVFTAFVIGLCALLLAIPPGSVSKVYSFLFPSDCDLQTYSKLICTMTLHYLFTFVMAIKDVAIIIDSAARGVLHRAGERLRLFLWEWLQPPLPPTPPPPPLPLPHFRFNL